MYLLEETKSILVMGEAMDEVMNCNQTLLMKVKCVVNIKSAMKLGLDISVYPTFIPTSSVSFLTIIQIKTVTNLLQFTTFK